MIKKKNRKNGENSNEKHEGEGDRESVPNITFSPPVTIGVKIRKKKKINIIKRFDFVVVVSGFRFLNYLQNIWNK